MDKFDTDPNRRNLFLISIIFIIYFGGGGTIEGGKINLPYVNIVIQHTIVLFIVMWGLMFYFLHTYWTNNLGKVSKIIKDGFEEQVVSKYLDNFVKNNNKANHKLKEDQHFLCNIVEYPFSVYYLHYRVVEFVKYRDDGSIDVEKCHFSVGTEKEEREEVDKRKIKLHFISNFKIFFVSFMRTLVRKKLVRNTLPYILSILGICLGGYRLFVILFCQELIG